MSDTVVLTGPRLMAVVAVIAWCALAPFFSTLWDMFAPRSPTPRQFTALLAFAMVMPCGLLLVLIRHPLDWLVYLLVGAVMFRLGVVFGHDGRPPDPPSDGGGV